MQDHAAQPQDCGGLQSAPCTDVLHHHVSIFHADTGRARVPAGAGLLLCIHLVPRRPAPARGRLLLLGQHEDRVSRRAQDGPAGRKPRRRRSRTEADAVSVEQQGGLQEDVLVPSSSLARVSHDE